MADFSIELQGSIYFFYRPKVEHQEAHSLEDVQRFVMILKPDKVEKYVSLRVGKKALPSNEQSYFALVSDVTNSLDELIKLLGEEHYETATRGTRTLAAMRCVGEGKFLIIQHHDHTHLMYQLAKPPKIGQVQAAFNLALKDDFIITVKNPHKPSPPKVGLTPSQKAKFSKALEEKLDDYRFVPLVPADFLYYPGAELVLLAKSAKYIEAHEVSQCLASVQEKDILPKLAEIGETPSIAPIIDRSWV